VASENNSIEPTIVGLPEFNWRALHSKESAKLPVTFHRRLSSNEVNGENSTFGNKV
jgi:hypothetical protein